MDIYLMRHGKYDASTLEKKLSKEGILQAKKKAKFLKKLNLHFDQIITSEKKRAIETAEIIAEEFGKDKTKILKSPIINPNANLKDMVDFISKKENVFVVGHLPILQKVISYLLTYDEDLLELDISELACTKISLQDGKAVLEWHYTF